MATSTPPSRRTTRDARQHLREVVDEVQRKGEPVIITRHGRDAVAVVPLSQLSEESLKKRKIWRG